MSKVYKFISFLKCINLIFKGIILKFTRTIYLKVNVEKK